MQIVTVSSKGQIAIPREICESLHLKNGTKLQLEVRGSEIVFMRTPEWRVVLKEMQPIKASTDDLLEQRVIDRDWMTGKSE